MTDKAKSELKSGKVKVTAKPGKYFYVGKDKITEGNSAKVTPKAQERLVKNGLAE